MVSRILAPLSLPYVRCRALARGPHGRFFFRRSNEPLSATQQEPGDSAEEPHGGAEYARTVIRIEKQSDQRDDCTKHRENRARNAERTSPRPRHVRKPDPQGNERSELKQVRKHRAEYCHIEQHGADRT